ncbi:MAG: FixH family protein [Cyclobacteriaceae bacterium]
MNWGKSIIVAFILFAAFIATLVTVCVREDISLVTKDYYKEELDYQRQIDRISNTANLREKPVIAIDGQNMLKVTFSDFRNVDNGGLKLFRPSDPAMDKHFELKKSSTSAQYFSIEGFQKGMYRAKMQWTMDGKEFYHEQIIQI